MKKYKFKKTLGARSPAGLVHFQMVYRRDASSNRGFKEIPNTYFRQAIALNLVKIEKFLKTRLARDANGNIDQPIGGGSYGIVFHLENGEVLKITRDETEAANALFFRGAQRRLKKIRRATCKIGKIAKIKNKKGQHLGLIEREYVNKITIDTHDTDLVLGMNTCVDQLIAACVTTDLEDKKEYLDLARDALRTHLVRAYPYLYYTLMYAWNRGVPQLDLVENNLGIRQTSKNYGYTKAGDVVIFDFGQGNQTKGCWQEITENGNGEEIRPHNILKAYDRKVPFI